MLALGAACGTRDLHGVRKGHLEVSGSKYRDRRTAEAIAFDAEAVYTPTTPVEHEGATTTTTTKLNGMHKN